LDASVSGSGPCTSDVYCFFGYCGIGFEEIVFHIERGDLLDILEHPDPERYVGQRVFVVRREAYVYLVPFVEDEHTVFLKTIIPSRKATKE
jgi:hypothetical protein